MANFSNLLSGLPQDIQIILADVGSAGGLHKRWDPVRSHVSAVLFDPLDESTISNRDRYFPVALASGAGRATLNVTKRVSMTSMLLPNRQLLSRFWDKPDHTSIVSTLDIPTEALDSVMEKAGIALDAIKIDVQGGEHEILKGARACLDKSIFLAEVEVSFLERYSGLRKFNEVVALMAESGFELIDISRIKRYRYRNRSGIVNPGLGLGDRAGRLAFCDAIFMLNDEKLLGRIATDPQLGLKAMLALLVYGKADIAAWIFDAMADRLEKGPRDAFARYYRGLAGRHLGWKGLHRALDYLARRV
jgi:FkbM family methyltransferase